VISYQAVGSGAGIEQFLARTVDFAASDAPLTDDQLARAGGPNAALHIPATMRALAISYNLPGLSHALNFTPDVIADIFLGKITSWDDARLSAINPDLALPTLAISVVHRSDGSGTTDVFTDYLSKVSSDWRTAVGRGTTVSWPVGAGGAGNDGVADGIKGSIGGIGYVELAYAQLNGLAVGTVQNSSGAFVEPSIASTAEAATVLSFGLPADLRYSITNAPGRDVYPIAGTTWFLVYADQPDPVKGQQLAQFLWWATHNGQALGADFSYAPLRPELVRRVEEQIFRLQCGGSACYSRGPLSPSA
jgi:phosphate transport system substrate-binding protein